MNFAVRLEIALRAHGMLASQNSQYVWSIVDHQGRKLGEILDGAKGASIRHSVTSKTNATVIRHMLKSMPKGTK